MWRWAPWLVLAVVAVVVLVVGTPRHSHPSLQAETLHIAGLVRCPVCEGQSAAQSDVAASVQIRNQIQQQLTAGQSQSRILSGLVAAYGPGILEKPEAKGIGLVVWVVPVIGVVAAIGGLAVAFARWRPRRTPMVNAADRELVAQALRVPPGRGDGGEGGRAVDGGGAGVGGGEAGDVDGR
ncbi:MAG TPA: cytochrome c-type biogenesis protein CcmH [Acidimicrobiales bacterium]